MKKWHKRIDWKNVAILNIGSIALVFILSACLGESIRYAIGAAGITALFMAAISAGVIVNIVNEHKNK